MSTADLEPQPKRPFYIERDIRDLQAAGQGALQAYLSVMGIEQPASEIGPDQSSAPPSS